jgi:hypothetical protein
MEERLLLDWVAGECADVAVGNEECAVVIKPDPADAVTARLHHASVSAGEALNRAPLTAFNQRFGCRGAVLLQHVLKGLEPLLFIHDRESHSTLHWDAMILPINTLRLKPRFEEKRLSC